MFARKTPGGRAGASAAADSFAFDRGNAIIGHRLPTGKLYIHPPLQPCELCDQGVRQASS
jgi:hypothetical protein